MRRTFRAVLATAAAVVLTTAMGAWGPGTAQAHSSCATAWGSLPEAGPAMTTARVDNIRAGGHACFDRLVVDVAGNAADAYSVRYVPAVREDGAGDVVPLRGGAFLEVIVRAPVNPTDEYFVSAGNIIDTSSYRTFRQVDSAVANFEGQTTLGLGVRARLPFRVMVLPGPGSNSRVVVDVAHRW